MRRRIVAAVGCPKSVASAWRRQRRRASPIVPEPSAASCSLREAVMERRATSATTAPSPRWPKAFFETGEDRFLVSWFDIDHPIRCKPGQRERWSERIQAGHAPHHAATRPRRDPRGEECGGSAVDCAVSAACHFVQRSECRTDPLVVIKSVDGGGAELVPMGWGSAVVGPLRQLSAVKLPFYSFWSE
jgi:hypothetical protein